MEKTQRKEMEFQLRRREILKEAEKIFAAKGFYNTTIAEIADASGFAVGTLYHFFEGKEKLYATMTTEKLDMMYSEIWTSVSSLEKVADKIEMLIRAHFHFVENNVDFCNLFIRGEGMGITKGDTILKEKLNRDFLSHIDFIKDIMHRGIEESFLKVMEPRMMAFAFWGIIRSFIYEWMLTGRETPLSDKVVSVLDIFLRGVKAEDIG
jgi:AcrR family transcriptional regulator